jgi:hypothetical protein
MRLITHSPLGPDKLLRIETPGCDIHVTVGVHDVLGREMVTVEVIPAEPADDGTLWAVDGPTNIRVITTAGSL